MSTACFARALQRGTSRLSKHFLLTFQEVTTLRKTRNQLILSAVDNRCYKRILYDVLDHDPTHDDIRLFLRRLHTALSTRNLTLVGVTTDGSALYPVPLAEVFGDVPHQICTFHIVAEVNKAI